VQILIVHDDIVAAGGLSNEVARIGHSVACVSVTEEMPAQDGFDAAMAVVTAAHPSAAPLISRVRAWSAGTPVVAIVDAALGDSAVLETLNHGPDDVLTFPAVPGLLRHRLQAVAERASLRAAAEENLRSLGQLSHDLREVILPLGISLSTEKNVDRLLEQILLQAKAMCGADAGTLYVRTRDDRLKFSIMLTDSLGVALGGTTGKEIPFPPLRMIDPETGAPNHRNIATWVALHGESINIDDIYGTTRFDFAATREFDRRNNYRSVSTLTVPLKDNADQVVAVLQLLNALDPVSGKPIAFASYHQLVVESLASQAAVVFNNQLLLQRQEALLKFERDLQIGRQIQAGFLPETLPEPEGWEVAARFMPAREVAGDFYDAFMLGDNTMGIVVADVCDKGVGAALFMALVRSLIRVYAQQRYAALSAEALATEVTGPNAGDIAGCGVTGAALRQAVILANDYIGANHLSMNMFATMFAAAVNIRTGALEWVNAGHNAPILLHASGEVTRLPSRSPAVGMVPGYQFVAKQGELQPGDLLVVFSDGIPDARDPQNQFFTEPRLLALVESMRGRTAEAVASAAQERLIEHISTAAQFDDITLMAVRRVHGDPV
jgi:sigma-B regulation protein RsbU (phosphoserine phosphatase)